MLESMPATVAHVDRPERRGVGERRHVVGGIQVSREPSELERLLAARGMEMALGPERDGARGLGEDLGFGLG
jgi:hypothetical protein